MTDLISLEQRKQFAENQGVDTDRLHSFQLELDILRQNGLLVDLDISGATMFQRQASWIELGVVDETTQKRYTKGHRNLLPDEVRKRLNSNVTKRRQNLEKYAIPVKGFAPYKWISWKAYPEWKERDQSLLEEFQSIKIEIIENYDNYIDQAAGDFATSAIAAWNSMVLGQGYTGATIDGVVYDDLDSFVDGVVRQAVNRFPVRDEIEKCLRSDYTTALVYGEGDVEQDYLIAQQTRQQLELKQQENLHQQRMWNLEEQEKQAKIKAMRQAEIEHARQYLEEVGSPLSDVILQVRNQIAASAETMIQSIKKNGFVAGKIAQQGKGLLDFYKMMAVAHDDAQLSELLTDLRALIGNDSESRSVNTDKIIMTLQDLSGLVNTTTQELTEISRASFIEF